MIVLLDTIVTDGSGKVIYASNQEGESKPGSLSQEPRPRKLYNHRRREHVELAKVDFRQFVHHFKLFWV